MIYRCVSDSYDPTGSISYSSVNDFLAMCQEVFGESPDLNQDIRGCWRDLSGDVVLEPLED